MSTANGGNKETQHCSSGSRKKTTGKNAHFLGQNIGHNVRLWAIFHFGTKVLCSTVLCHCPCSEQCRPVVQDGAAIKDASERGTAQCRYETREFAIGVTHTVFFIKNNTETPCSSVPHKPLDLSQHCEFTWHLSIVTVTLTVVMIIEINCAIEDKLIHFIRK